MAYSPTLSKGFLNKFRELYPEKPFIPIEKRNTFYIDHQYREELGLKVFHIILQKGYYRSVTAYFWSD